MNYKFDTKIDIPDFIAWSQAQQKFNHEKAKERDAAFQNLMKQIGLGVAAARMHGGNNDVAGLTLDWNDKGYDWNDDQKLDLMMAGFDPNLTSKSEINGLLGKEYNSDLDLWGF